MTIHEVKSWIHFYDAILKGDKKHDLRKNDRNYKVGDFVKLMRYDFVAGEYTGDYLVVKITYITSNQFPCAFSSSVLPHDYCILSLDKDFEDIVPWT